MVDSAKIQLLLLVVVLVVLVVGNEKRDSEDLGTERLQQKSCNTSRVDRPIND